MKTSLWFSLLFSCLLASNLQAAVELPLHSKIWLEPKGQTVPTQQSKLIIELSSPLRFAKSAKIPLPELAGLIVLQQEQFATNYGEMRGSQWWNIQRWELVVYPQKAATFKLPTMQISTYLVVEEPDTVKTQQITTKALSLTAAYPDDKAFNALSATDKKHLIAAPTLHVDDSFDRSIDDLEMGDAIERTITITATDSHSVLMPELLQQAYEGLAWYPKLPKKNNSVNRGEYSASVSYHHDFIAQQNGTYVFPEQHIVWWNTRNNSLQLIKLEEQHLVVGGDSSIKPVLKNLSDTELASQKQQTIYYTFFLVLALLILAVLLYIAVHYYKKSAEKRALFALLKKAAKLPDNAQALNFIYQFLDRQQASDYHWQLQALLNERQLEDKANSWELMQLIYAKAGGKEHYDKKKLIRLLKQNVKPQKSQHDLFILNPQRK